MTPKALSRDEVIQITYEELKQKGIKDPMDKLATLAGMVDRKAGYTTELLKMENNPLAMTIDFR